LAIWENFGHRLFFISWVYWKFLLQTRTSRYGQKVFDSDFSKTFIIWLLFIYFYWCYWEIWRLCFQFRIHTGKKYRRIASHQICTFFIFSFYVHMWHENKVSGRPVFIGCPSTSWKLLWTLRPSLVRFENKNVVFFTEETILLERWRCCCCKFGNRLPSQNSTIDWILNEMQSGTFCRYNQSWLYLCRQKMSVTEYVDKKPDSKTLHSTKRTLVRNWLILGTYVHIRDCLAEGLFIYMKKKICCSVLYKDWSYFGRTTRCDTTEIVFCVCTYTKHH
jgi:hypothetical protein